MENFHTFRDYMNRLESVLTASMEDYLEMIYRLSEEKGFTRTKELSLSLNVRPPTVTRMIQKLSAQELLDYKKYGSVTLLPKGILMGEALLKRHELVEKFLIILGIDNQNILTETEKIEHTISVDTLKSIACFVDFISKNPDIKILYDTFRNQNKF